jgi:hypothetical protein
MPQLNLPMTPAGMTAPAVVGLNDQDSAALVQAGRPIPRPVRVVALLDTAADLTAVPAPLVTSLGLAPLISGSTYTAGGPVAVGLYRVSLSIFGPAGAAGPMLVRPDLLVSELTVPLPNVDILVGLDVLRSCLLVQDGPGQQFIVAF